MSNEALDLDSAEPCASAFSPPMDAAPAARVVRLRRAALRPPSRPAGWFHRLYAKVEVFVSRLSTRYNVWHSICTFIWLPLAAFSGIRMKRLDSQTFVARLPFTRFNRNWYGAVAGGALLANSEIAGGMYVFGVCGADYTVVCKNLNYTFLRPCLGPAVYHIFPRANIQELIAAGGEFNIVVDMVVRQEAARSDQREKRVGKCTAIFHVAPKALARSHRAKRRRQVRRLAAKTSLPS
jgi:acyl-coenzyme A thioesterase PaaI-like protein